MQGYGSKKSGNSPRIQTPARSYHTLSRAASPAAHVVRVINVNLLAASYCLKMPSHDAPDCSNMIAVTVMIQGFPRLTPRFMNVATYHLLRPWGSGIVRHHEKGQKLQSVPHHRISMLGLLDLGECSIVHLAMRALVLAAGVSANCRAIARSFSPKKK